MKILNKNNTPESLYSTYKERLAVRAIIIKDGKVLLIRSNKYDTYTLPGGGVEDGESLEQAAIREAKEETGIEITIGDKVGIATEVYDKPNILNVTTAFSTNIVDEHDMIPDPESVEEDQELVWIPLNEVVKLIDTTNSAQHTSMLRDAFFIQQYLKL